MRCLLLSPRRRQHRSSRVRLALVAPVPRSRGYGHCQKRPSLAPSSPGGGPCTGRLSMDFGDLADFELRPSACHPSTSTPFSGIDCSSCLVSPCRGPLKQWARACLLRRPAPRRAGRVGWRGHESRQARYRRRAGRRALAAGAAAAGHPDAGRVRRRRGAPPRRRPRDRARSAGAGDAGARTGPAGSRRAGTG